MVESIYFLKPAWCGTHLAGLWPEKGLQPVILATAFQAVVWRLAICTIKLARSISLDFCFPMLYSTSGGV